MKHIWQLATLAVWLWGGGMGLFGQVISSFSPTYGQAGSYVTIVGNNLSNSTVVRFGTSVATATLTGYSNGMGMIRATVPANLSAPVYLSAQNGSGALYYFSSYMFTNIGTGPFITGFTPTNGGAGDVGDDQRGQFQRDHQCQIWQSFSSKLYLNYIQPNLRYRSQWGGYRTDYCDDIQGVLHHHRPVLWAAVDHQFQPNQWGGGSNG